MKSLRALPVMLCLGAMLASCAVGPDFREPAAPVVSDATHPYTEGPIPPETASAPGRDGEAQRFVPADDLPASWWHLFHSDPLDRLIRSALARSPTLASAQAALRQAQENYAADRGTRLSPAVSAQVSGDREKLAGSGLYNLYNASISVSYTVDAFGGIRRELEGLEAQTEYERFQLEAAYLSLTANLVTTAIQEASLRAQLAATRDVLDAEQKALAVIRTQARLGAVARSSVLLQQTLVAQTIATIPPLEKTLAQTRLQLAIYAGQLPSDPGVPEFGLDALVLPSDLPVSVPSQLVRQRPDIRSAEALLHQASANVGVATANLYPQIALSGDPGTQAAKIGKLFSAGTASWSLLASLSQPIFDGGSLRAKRRASIAAFDQAGATYQGTVLNAFLDVGNALSALKSDADALHAQADAESLAKQTFDLANSQFKLGATSYLTLLDAQRTYQQTRVALVQAQAARLSDTAALFQALGGVWWNRGDLIDISNGASSGLVVAKP